MPNSSIRSRFAITIIVNVLRALLTFATGLLIARGLGPEDYGRFTFLLGSFIAVRQLLDMGSSSAFFTFISQRLRSKAFFGYYIAWLALQFVIPLFIIGVLFPVSWIDLIWKGEERAVILLAFAAVFFQYQAWQMAVQIGESQRLTHRIQAINLGVAVAHGVIVGLYWWFEILNLYNLFIIIFLEFFIALSIAYKALPIKVEKKSSTRLFEVLGEYKRYCLPLIPYAWVGFAYEFADRWLLQHYGGAVQQAYYGISAQFAAVSLIATTSILGIFWKEIAETHHQGNKERMAMLYRKVSRMLYMVGAILSGFLIPWTTEIIELTLGQAYLGGTMTMAIMFLFPIQQSIGQISGTMLYATGQTQAQMIIGIAFMLISIIITYFVLATENAFIPGLGLGSTGLALKMVILAIIQINILAWWVARINGWKYDDWTYQILGTCISIGSGYFCNYFVRELLFDDFPLIMSFIIVGGIYTICISVAIAVMPWLIGMQRKEMNFLLSRIFSNRKEVS